MTLDFTVIDASLLKDFSPYTQMHLKKVDLCEGYFSYKYFDNEFDIVSSRISFHFSIPDTIRYRHWHKNLKRKEEKEKADAVMEKVEKLWAEDAVNAVQIKSVDEKEREKTNVN